MGLTLSKPERFKKKKKFSRPDIWLQISCLSCLLFLSPPNDFGDGTMEWVASVHVLVYVCTEVRMYGMCVCLYVCM